MTACDYCGKTMWLWQRQWHGPLYNHPWTHEKCHQEREREFIERHGEEELAATWRRLIERTRE